MIKNFKNKGLSQLYYEDSKKGINPNYYKRLKLILSILNSATSLKAIDMPGFRLHPLKGDLQGFYAIDVVGNWRVIFQFNEAQAEVYDIDLIDYH